MSSRPARPIFDSPVHVTTGADGEVVLFLPNGESLAITMDAAARSSMLLSQTVCRSREPRRRARGATGNVIAVDFVGHALSA